MTTRAIWLALAVATVACGKQTSTGVDEPRTAIPPDDVCVPPERAADVVIAITQHVVPIGKSAEIGESEVTARGACTPGADCVVVDAAAMERLVARVRSLGRVRHRNGGASPHYGSRTIAVRSPAASCSLHDGSTAPIDDRDREAFDALWSAIDATIERARRDGG
jgi:hypothetical protein